jgi:hypothetical protein
MATEKLAILILGSDGGIGTAIASELMPHAYVRRA